MSHATEVLDTIDSTNVEAMRRIAAGHRAPLWIVARRQTRGRGRSGRAWTSEPGNFYGSFLLPLPCKPAVVYQLSLVMGVAVVDAIAEVVPAARGKLRLKWPNDVLLGGAKACGLLAESTTDAATGGVLAVLGIGINLAHAPELADRRTTSLAASTGHAINTDEMFRTLAKTLDHWLVRWQNGHGFAAVRQAWLDRGAMIGDSMDINTGHGRRSGTFAGLDPTGALMLDIPMSGIETFTYGDVTLVPESADAADTPRF